MGAGGGVGAAELRRQKEKSGPGGSPGSATDPREAQELLVPGSQAAGPRPTLKTEMEICTRSIHAGFSPPSP